ncbi:uncharacterized protein BO88DRAFT_452271 [Aspergillus vadensis CBS 113365]|uniref:Uncharacterized protein n=1 Tax=Aspergillus vadensis (strain CBS 113365 / IMI 142717 / IBT 24658) TaxID=1448311 RepID=A0A319C5T8_ASPVC|nr:hypothetical protein BO88DRAFT_452271 [Aspergillus vadensis CBS 113365]PYH70748.1 hypothetical protein BO88DRAFT_452271 [Aspergillus vadensis CBS 113365]
MVTTRKKQMPPKRPPPDIEEKGKGPAVYPNGEYLCQQEEYHDIMEHHFMMGMLTRPHIRSAPEIVRNGFSLLALRVQGWAMAWGESKPMYRLSDDDKRMIIESLDGFCVQDDWDSIYSSLPPGGRADFGVVLLETMMNKFIYDKFAASTFWFMDAKMDAADQEGDDNFCKRLDYVYERFKETLPKDAAWWKSTLVSVCMMRASEWVSNPPPTPLLHATLERRKALLKAYGDELLASQPFQLLFRGSLSEKDQAIREERTREVLEEAAHQFTSLQGDMFGNLVVKLLPELPISDRHANNMDHHILHVGFMPHHATNGWQSRPPLQIVTARVLTAPKGPKARARWAAAGFKPIYIAQGHTNTAEKEGVNQEEAVEEGSDGEYKPRKLRRTYLRGAEDE